MDLGNILMQTLNNIHSDAVVKVFIQFLFLPPSWDFDVSLMPILDRMVACGCDLSYRKKHHGSLKQTTTTARGPRVAENKNTMKMWPSFRPSRRNLVCTYNKQNKEASSYRGTLTFTQHAHQGQMKLIWSLVMLSPSSTWSENYERGAWLTGRTYAYQNVRFWNSGQT